jgi:DNA-binding response OmpR family regulator
LETGEWTVAQLTGQTVLIVEDEGLQAVDLMAMLQADDAEVIAAQTMEDAISVAQQKRISVAVLDVKLQNGKDCAPICHFLQERRVPFVFLTGFPEHHVLGKFPNVPVLPKPATKEQLLECITGVIWKDNSKRRSANLLSEADHLNLVGPATLTKL